MNVPERIAKLRTLMEEKGIDIYIVPTADFHQSEYVGEHFKARKFITGFSGSAGTAVITKEGAYLWTDGRYFIQAAKQLEGSTVELMKMGEPGVPTIHEFLADTLPENGTLGFDGRVVSMGEGQDYESIATEKHGKIVYEYDLIDQIWEDRPALSEEPVFALNLKYTGETVASKLSRIREDMKNAGATAHVLTTLDDICWTLNIRGNDIEFFPLVLSYAVITMDKVDLYINEAKLSSEIKADLEKDGVVFHPYNDIYEDIKKIGTDEVLLIDPARLNYALYNNIPEGVAKVEERNPEILFKAIKNEVEIENIRQAQIKDSVAHVKFMKWLKENVGKMTITEMSASDKLDEFRAEQGNFIRPSFEPISSYGEHGAIVHYTSSPETDVAISNLSLANARFLKGCTGMTLDMLARKPFWDRNLNFNHGTGHGVGYLLNIHEGPAGFRWQFRAGEIQPFEKGMIITDEPGIYIEGSHGIRLENELLTCEGEKNEYGQFMYFEPITYIPMDLDAINPEIMTAEEKKMLNDYHKTVYEKISPYLDNEEKEWLRTYTREI